jgi:hypothetical protein
MIADLVVNLATGEVLEHLDHVPPETLAEALEALRDRQTQFKQWQSDLESELRRRLRLLDRKLSVFGEYEVAMTTPQKSEWDVEILEAGIASLVDQGVLKSGEVTEVVDRTPTVRAGEATKLINRLSGEPKRALEAARTWKEQPGKLTVVRSVQLPAAAERDSLALEHGDRRPGPDTPRPTGPAELPRAHDLFERPLQPDRSST